MLNHPPGGRFACRRAALAAASLSLLALAACNSSSSSAAAGGGAGPSAAGGVTSAAAQSATVAGDGCDLVTPAQLGQATGATYTAIKDANGICNVTGASATDSFYFHVDKEDGAMTTWKEEVATIKEDDGSVKSVPGLGDQAAQGAIKEFAAEAGGYIVVVVNADVNNPPTAQSFTRTKKIEQLLIGKV